MKISNKYISAQIKYCTKYNSVIYFLVYWEFTFYCTSCILFAKSGNLTQVHNIKNVMLSALYTADFVVKDCCSCCKHSLSTFCGVWFYCLWHVVLEKLSCVFLYSHTSDTRCVCFPHIKQFCPASWVSYSLTHCDTVCFELALDPTS